MACHLFVHHASLLHQPSLVLQGTETGANLFLKWKRAAMWSGLSSGSSTESDDGTHMREHMLKCFDQSPGVAETGLSSSPCGGWHHRIQEGSIHCQRSSSDSGCCSCCLRMYRPHRRVLLRKRRFISISIGVITPPAACEASPDAEHTVLGDLGSHYQAALFSELKTLIPLEDPGGRSKKAVPWVAVYQQCFMEQ